MCYNAFQEMNMKTELFETSDLAFASYLYCSGTPLADIDRQNPRRCVFVFNSPNPALVTKWQEGKAIANVLTFYNSYQTLKRVLYKG
jgi:hypothetical protein